MLLPLLSPTGNAYQSIDKETTVPATAESELARMSHDTDESKVRYRRTQSVTRAEEITKKESNQRKSQPDKP